MSQASGQGSGTKPAALGFIYAAILMNVLSQGVIIPVFPTLVKSLANTDDGGAAQITGLFGAAWALMQLIFAPIFGALSDRFGRRPVLLVSMFGLAIDYVIMALAPNIGWLFVGRVLSGITSASGAAAGAYVADVSTPDNRARNFGRFQAAANAGIVLGPALGGFGAFVGITDPRAPFWVAAGLATLNGLYGLFMVPESLTPDRRAPFRWASANAWGSLVMLRSYPGLFGLALVIFLGQFAAMSFNSVFQFYTHLRFNWGPAEIATLLIVLGLGSIVVSSVLAGISAKRLGERGSVLLGVAIQFSGYLFLGLAPTQELFWAAVGVIILSGIYFPSIQSMMSDKVGVDEQGRLAGAMSIFFGITGLAAPVVFTSAFAWSVGPGKSFGVPGLAFLIGAAILAGAFVMALVFARPGPTRAPAPEE